MRGIDFAMESQDGDVFIFEVKSAMKGFGLFHKSGNT
jgi:hypothetical protein